MLPAEPGTYVLVLRWSSTRAIRIGRLGAVRLRPGCYLYVGSAFGPGGLRARIAHHARRSVSPHWHIDYLRLHVRLTAVWYVCGDRREHELAAAIGALPGALAPMPGFGSSDCRCGTHLFWFAERPGIQLRIEPVSPRGGAWRGSVVFVSCYAGLGYHKLAT